MTEHIMVISDTQLNLWIMWKVNTGDIDSFPIISFILLGYSYSLQRQANISTSHDIQQK